MSLSDLASLATVISSLTVLASLIYVGLQLRQNTKHTKALLWQGAAARGVNMNLSMAEEKLAAAFIAGNGETPTPEAVERRQFFLQCTALYAQIDDMFTQWDDGLVEEDRFGRFRSTFVAMLAGNPGLRECFAKRAAIGSVADTAYHAFIRAALKEAEAH